MASIQSLVANQRAFFDRGLTLQADFRRQQLLALRRAIVDREEAISQALKLDLGKSAFEAYTTEIRLVLEELDEALGHLNRWMRRRSVSLPLTHFPARGYLYAQPYGLALIMAPWNYPFQLTLLPLVSAIAAGNCAIVKPSAYAVHTSGVIRDLIADCFNPAYVAVVEGGREENSSLLQETFDTIFFTGSPAVGRVVMAAAAEHLTPVTLELGGKSPCIVDETARLDLAARRIVWGKLLNAGQTCVAPDYLLVQETVKEALIDRIKRYMLAFYGGEACTNPHYPRIINDKHFQRLLGLMEGEGILFGGRACADSLRIEPTILGDVAPDSPIMEEEIFGPLLPVLTFQSLQEAVDEVQRRPKPLALYYFSQSRERQRWVLENTTSGGGCINDTVMQVAAKDLPFGGVGESGMGSYHGKAGFDAFTHYRGVIHGSTRLDLPLRYPPYDEKKGLLKVLRWLDL